MTQEKGKTEKNPRWGREDRRNNCNEEAGRKGWRMDVKRGEENEETFFKKEGMKWKFVRLAVKKKCQKYSRSWKSIQDIKMKERWERERWWAGGVKDEVLFNLAKVAWLWFWLACYYQGATQCRGDLFLFSSLSYVHANSLLSASVCFYLLPLPVVQVLKLSLLSSWDI